MEQASHLMFVGLAKAEGFATGAGVRLRYEMKVADTRQRGARAMVQGRLESKFLGSSHFVPFLRLCPDCDSGDLLFCFRCCGTDRRQNKKGFVSGQVEKDEPLARTIVIDARSEWYCRFCSGTNVWTGSKCRRCKTDIPSVVHSILLQAVSSKTGRSWSASSSAGAGSNVGVQSPVGKGNRVAWGYVKMSRHPKGEGKKPAGQFEETSEEGKPDEDCEMEVESEADSHKKLGHRKKDIAK